MNDQIKTDRELHGAIKELPLAIKPKRDLWPSIAARLAAPAEAGARRDARPALRHQALAASVAIAFVAGLMFGRQMGNGGPAESLAMTPDPVMQAVLAASEREYQAAFREFIPVGASAPLLESEAVQNIEGSWADLQQAEAALLAALHEYPENTYLNQKLLDLRAQQLGFMKQLATLDHFSRRKT